MRFLFLKNSDGFSDGKKRKKAHSHLLSLFLSLKKKIVLELRPALVVDVEARKTGLLVRGKKVEQKKGEF